MSFVPGAAAFSINTRDSPPGREIDFWTEATDSFLPLTLSNFPRDFQGDCQARTIGQVLSVEIHCSRVDTRRGPADIARKATGACFVFEQLDPAGSAFRRPGEPDGFLRSGDLMLGDADCAWESLSETRFGHRFWLIPRSFVPGWSPAAGTLELGMQVPRSAPLARLLLGYLKELGDLGSELDPQVAEGCADVAGRLLALAAGADGGDEPLRDAAAVGELAVVKRQIEARLTDPLLSPSRIAARCGISVRKLHALFEPTGVTFTAHVTGRRLELARSALRDPCGARQTIADLAFSLGFNSLSAFYRAYGRAFGEARATAGPTERPVAGVRRAGSGLR